MNVLTSRVGHAFHEVSGNCQAVTARDSQVRNEITLTSAVGGGYRPCQHCFSIEGPHVSCDNCGVKYDASRASWQCPVCKRAHRLKPEVEIDGGVSYAVDDSVVYVDEAGEVALFDQSKGGTERI